MTSARVAFLWHMQQPSSEDPLDGTLSLPWVRLHALKDYLGMPALVERTDGMRATFALAPVLVDQLERYARGETLEPLQRLSRAPAESLGEHERVAVLRGLPLGARVLLSRFPRLVELIEARGPAGDERRLREAARRFSVEDLRDLQLLATLAWFDLDWLAGDPELLRLEQKGRGFDESDKARLAARETALLGEVLAGYRRVAAGGRVELCTSPYHHPILPLLCDSASHHEARPGTPLPRRFQHPEDAHDQIRRAVERHAEVFGEPPQGLWPPEAAISEAALAEMARCGIGWTASDESVLERTVGRPLHRDSRGGVRPPELLYRPWLRRTEAGDVRVLFRDRALSDLVGFSYSALDPERAAHDLLDRCRRSVELWAEHALPGEPVVGIMLDGENAWEHFRDGGRDFLKLVYEGLVSDPGLRPVTVGEAVTGTEPAELPRVFAGSWVNAELSTWVAHADHRRAWDLLGECRDALSAGQHALAADERERAWRIFGAACGSDWFWWYAERETSEDEGEFDRLFRRHLQAIYRLLGQEPPEALLGTLVTARRLPERHCRPTGQIVPVLDGRLSWPDEWLSAGVYRAPASASGGSARITALRFGVGEEHLHLLLEASRPARELLGEHEVLVSLPGPTALRYRVRTAEGPPLREERTALGWVGLPSGARAVADELLEIGIPLSELRPGPAQDVELRVLLLRRGVEVERHPDAAAIRLDLMEVARE